MEKDIIQYKDYVISKTQNRTDGGSWWTIGRQGEGYSLGGVSDPETARSQIDLCESLGVSLGDRFGAQVGVFCLYPPDRPLFGRLVTQHRMLKIEWEGANGYSVVYTPQDGYEMAQRMWARSLLALLKTMTSEKTRG
jgi:hypothetical protein